MSEPTAWGTVQDAAYHLDRAIGKGSNALLLAGADMLPQARALLKDAGDFVQLAHKDVEALVVKGKKRKEAQAKVLATLTAAATKGSEAAAALFAEKVTKKAALAACAALAEAVALEATAMNGLLALRDPA